MAASDGMLIDAVATAAHPLVGSMEDFDPILEFVGDARLVLIGEATHGTHEFYHQRAQLTQRLILEKGFCAVAAEADWPEAYRVNRYVRGIGKDTEAVEALGDFKRFPAWMWRNADVLEFVAWLRERNGVVYFPGTERVSHYFHARLPSQFDALMHLDETRALEPLERTATWERGELPETYPTGM